MEMKFLLVLLAIVTDTVFSWDAHSPDVNLDKVEYFCPNRFGDMIAHYCDKFPARRYRRAPMQECCHGRGCSIRHVLDNYCEVVKPEYISLLQIRLSADNDSDSGKQRSTERTIIEAENKPTVETETGRSKFLQAIKNFFHAETNMLNTSTKPKSKTKSTLVNNAIRCDAASLKCHNVCNTFTKLSPRSVKALNLSKNRNQNVAFKIKKNKKSKTKCKCECCTKTKENKVIMDAKSQLKKSSIGTDYIPNNAPVHYQAKIPFKYQFY